MAEKKIPISAAPNDDAVVRRVKIMMEGDSEQPTVPRPEPTIDPKKYLPAAQITPITITSAPTVPPKMLKKIAITDHNDSPTEPKIPVPAATPVEEPLEIPALTATIGELTNAAAEEESATPLDDEKTDAAIDDIAEHDSDEILAVEDGTKELAKPVVKKSKQANFFKKKLCWIILVVLVLLAVFGIPFTRYKVLGLVLKNDVLVTVVDSTSQLPVSSAKISVNGQEVTTDAKGLAMVHGSVGSHHAVITKQYYANTETDLFFGIKSHNGFQVKLSATGRQVPITVINKITGLPLANADVKVLSVSAKTDKNGKATVVLPATAATQNATVSAKGYNTLKGQITVTAAVVAANKFAIVPAGKVYFLSNESGTIDVIKSDLDGTNRETVLKGTGKEVASSTSLAASKDWSYVVLKAQRDTAKPALYLINTTTDKSTEFDSGDADFTPIGWSGHYFMYNVVRSSVANTQSNRQVIKSYDAERGQLNQLDATQSDKIGDSGDYAFNTFVNFYIVDDQLIYNAQWAAGTLTTNLTGRNDTIRGVQPSGQNKKDYLTIDASDTDYIQGVQSGPHKVYYIAYGNKNTFYVYDSGTAKASTDITLTDFNKAYPNYITQPSGKKLLWSEQRDGKITPILGDQNGASSQVLTALAGYTSYGWFTDDYVLVTRDNGLYIAPATNPKIASKIANYTN